MEAFIESEANIKMKVKFMKKMKVSGCNAISQALFTVDDDNDDCRDGGLRSRSEAVGQPSWLSDV